jgi:adenosine deaminase
MKEARQAGLNLTVHAGEWAGADSVADALQLIGAQRIGHGVRILEDMEIVDLAVAQATTFEICLTSNYQSGVIAPAAPHPFIEMDRCGLMTTLNTDDPGISQITLSGEYQLACEQYGLPLAALREKLATSAAAAFLSPAEQQVLSAEIAGTFDRVAFNLP